MFDFFYDSLETVKEVKKPTKKEMIDTILAVFGIVIVSGVFFLAVDGVATSLYEFFHQIMMG